MARHIIIGDGAAGTTAAFYIRRADPSASISILSDDPNPAYYRAALTNYLIGELRESQLFAVPPDFYIEHRIDRVLARVAAVDSRAARLTLADGRQLPYDQLMLATGASPNPPVFPGAELSGVMTMRTLHDVRMVVDGIRSGHFKRAVVIGGGPLGIEWVQGLLRYKVHVTYLLRGDVFFERALDRTASDLVLSRLRAEGVDVRLNEEIEEAMGGRDGRLRAVRLKNSKQTLECQLLGAAIGIRPNVEFLKDSGIAIARDEKRGALLGVTVDRHMRTNVPNVYAGGDVIHRTLGLWEPARLQGRVAGRNMTGGSDVYEIGAHYNATRLYDLDFSSVGDLNDKPGDKVLVDFPHGSGRIAYRKAVVRENKLVGALMLGQRKERVRKYGLQYKKLIDTKVDVSEVADRLLDPAFDLAAWIDSLDLHSQIEAARSIVAAGSVPSPADLQKSSEPDVAGTFASKPLDAPPAALQKNGQTIPVQRTMQIGRRPDNQLVLDDPQASGRHARIQWQNIAYVIADAGSTNGTFVNDTRLTGPRALESGDLIRIGATRLKFTVVAEEKVAGPSGVREEAPVAQLPSDAALGLVEYGGRRVEVRAEPVTLGRDPEATISVEDPMVSYMHAQVSRHGNQLYLRDLGSRNGTFVNETHVVTPHVLKDGDVIRIGATRLNFRAAGQAAPKPVISVAASKAETELAQGSRLVVRTGPSMGVVFALNPPQAAVGRDPASHVSLPDQSVSWRHARLDWRDSGWSVTDLRSTNGTRVNGRKLEAEAETPLAPGDEVKFGDVVMRLEGVAPAPQPAEDRPRPPATMLMSPDEPAAPPPEPAPTPAPTGAVARLMVVDGELAGQLFRLTPPTCTLGRSPENQIVISARSVSGLHARFELRESDWYVSDLGSSLGTRVNGELLKPQAAVRLAPGDKLLLGTLRMEFTLSAPGQPRPTTGSMPAVAAPTPEPERPAPHGTLLMSEPPAPPPAPEEPESESTKAAQLSFPTRLVILAGPRKGQTILLVNLPIVLGRATTPQVQGLEDQIVSRQHLEIMLTPDGQIGVSDRGSVNGTFVNGNRLTPNDVIVINKGDELRLGNTVLRAD